MKTRLGQMVESRAFHIGAITSIILCAVLMGLETNPSLVSRNPAFFQVAHIAIQLLFVMEIGIRLLACAPKFSQFFRDRWNLFDFVIVFLSLLPVAGPFMAVARLARILRVARLLSLSAELRLIIDTMLKSIPSLGHVMMLLSLLLYVYGVMGYHLFHDNDPEHWGTLGNSFLSLFVILTLEGWVEMLKVVLPSHPYAWIFFVSFIVVAVFVVVNLFIAVVINNLQTVKANAKTP